MASLWSCRPRCRVLGCPVGGFCFWGRCWIRLWLFVCLMQEIPLVPVWTPGPCHLPVTKTLGEGASWHPGLAREVEDLCGVWFITGELPRMLSLTA